MFDLEKQIMVSFPGLGIDEFILNKIVLEIPIFGGIEIRWYGLIISLGMILAFLYAGYRSKSYNIIFDDVIDLGLFSVIFGVIGARLYYVIMEIESYHTFKDVIAIWNGGLAIYGGVIGGAIAVFCVAKYKSRKKPNISFPRCADIILPGVMIAQSLGRWGNFFNGEAFGGQVAERHPLYFMRMGLKSGNTIHDFGTTETVYVHPTFLYESLWNLLGFVLINLLWKKKKFDGEAGLWYVTWYGFGRMFIEGLRTDSLYVGNIRISQLIGFVCFIVGLGLIVAIRIIVHKRSKVAVNQEASTAKVEEVIDTEDAEIEKITDENSVIEEEKENGEDN